MIGIYTGYYINEDGHIVDNKGVAISRIQNNVILLSDGIQTTYSISKGKIINGDGEPTGYMIIDNSIFGPIKFLPWL